jgi:ribosome modulation factor
MNQEIINPFREIIQQKTDEHQRIEAEKKRARDEEQAREQMKRRAEEKLQRVARDGYKAKTRRHSINLNPYSKDTQPHLHAAWKAGFEYEPGSEPKADGSADTV